MFDRVDAPAAECIDGAGEAPGGGDGIERRVGVEPLVCAGGHVGPVVDAAGGADLGVVVSVAAGGVEGRPENEGACGEAERREDLRECDAGGDLPERSHEEDVVHAAGVGEGEVP